MPPLRRRVSLVIRVLVVTLLVAVLAEPRVQLPANDLAVAFLLDRSDSITPSMQADEERWLADALQHKAQQDQAAVISFAFARSLMSAWGSTASPSRRNGVSPGARKRTAVPLPTKERTPSSRPRRRRRPAASYV